MTAQRSVLFTFKVLLITRDATRYLQHKVHLPKLLPHAGTCGKALQVQTLSHAKRHSPPLQVLRTVTARISRTQRRCLAHVRTGPSDYKKRSHFSVIVSCTACGSFAATRSVRFSLRTFPCGLLRGTTKTASRREESEIVHRQPTAKR